MQFKKLMENIKKKIFWSVFRASLDFLFIRLNVQIFSRDYSSSRYVYFYFVLTLFTKNIINIQLYENNERTVNQ